MCRLPPLLLVLVLLGLGLAGPGSVSADVGADIVAALKRTLRSGPPEARRKAVKDVGAYSGQLSEAQMRVAARTLRKTFPEEPDRETRRLMVRAMATLRTPIAWVPVIVASQSDRDADIRAAARQEVLAGRPPFLDVLKIMLAQDQDATFRADLLLLLRDRRKPDAIPILLAAFQDDERRVVAAAAEALEAISGEAFGYDAAKWAAWHRTFLAEQPVPANGGGTQAPAAGPVEEPPPHVTRSLTPTFYGLRLTSKDVIFVVDISGSVGNTGVERAKKELTNAVELLGSDVYITALFFADEVHLWNKGEMVPATPTNKAKLAYFLRGVKPGRRTDVFTPFNTGLQILRKRVQAKREAGLPFREPATLIAVSDGRDTLAKTPPHVVEEKLDRLDLERTVVHAVVLGGKHSPLMRELARRGSGHYVLVGP